MVSEELGWPGGPLRAEGVPGGAELLILGLAKA